jgi:hypothetical protein
MIYSGHGGGFQMICIDPTADQGNVALLDDGAPYVALMRRD